MSLTTDIEAKKQSFRLRNVISGFSREQTDGIYAPEELIKIIENYSKEINFSKRMEFNLGEIVGFSWKRNNINPQRIYLYSVCDIIKKKKYTRIKLSLRKYYLLNLDDWSFPPVPIYDSDDENHNKKQNLCIKLPNKQLRDPLPIVKRKIQYALEYKKWSKQKEKKKTQQILEDIVQTQKKYPFASFSTHDHQDAYAWQTLAVHCNFKIHNIVDCSFLPF